MTSTEREKAERFFLRYFMDSPEKPELYHTLVARHGVFTDNHGVWIGGGGGGGGVRMLSQFLCCLGFILKYSLLPHPFFFFIGPQCPCAD